MVTSSSFLGFCLGMAHGYLKGPGYEFLRSRSGSLLLKMVVIIKPDKSLDKIRLSLTFLYVVPMQVQRR